MFAHPVSDEVISNDPIKTAALVYVALYIVFLQAHEGRAAAEAAGAGPLRVQQGAEDIWGE